jgi:hypothetical protein
MGIPGVEEGLNAKRIRREIQTGFRDIPNCQGKLTAQTREETRAFSQVCLQKPRQGVWGVVWRVYLLQVVEIPVRSEKSILSVVGQLDNA